MNRSKNINILLLILCCFTITRLPAQVSFSTEGYKIPPVMQEDDETYNFRGWQFGINMGMYFANKLCAGFYTGVPENENKISWVLENYYWYEEIRQELNSHQILDVENQQPKDPDDPNTTWWIYYPINLNYGSTISPGFYAKYNFNNSTGIFLQTNYVKLRTSGAFQMVIDSVTYTSEPALREGYIYSTEERAQLDLGISKFYKATDVMHIFVELGVHMSSTRVLEHKMRVGNKDYTLINQYGDSEYIPNSNMQAYDIYQGGIGFGMFLSLGPKFILTEKISVDPGVQFTWQKVNLTGYDDFGMDTYAYVRLIFGLFD